MRYFMGIDPDMHQMPVVVVDETGKLCHVQIVEVDKKLTGREALVEMVNKLQLTDLSESFESAVCATTIEAQEIYQFGASKTKNPKSIMFLATVAGAAMQRFGFDTLYFPTPQEWKGNVPKQIHQARVLGRIGISYTKVGTQESGYCMPCILDVSQFNVGKASNWKHVVDAIGLAQYGREKFLEEEARSDRSKNSSGQPQPRRRAHYNVPAEVPSVHT